MDYLQVLINAIVVALMAMYVYEIERKMGKMSTKHDLTEKELDALKIVSKLLKSNEKGSALYKVTYIRWGKAKCDGPSTETIYSGQVGGGLFDHSGTSVNYICLPNEPDIAQPLKLYEYYSYLYGAEYELSDSNKPQGIRSGIGNHDVACAACLAKEKYHQS
ncbi:unnamed protein product [Mytilus edulis]|uniref:Uncharacterized protein n=1 Tax=Mytilus edulis TaxID=6550 RepID=A0A8S3VJV9_MYTED|nr:unnamed protein product [Mytilus edulis]